MPLRPTITYYQGADQPQFRLWWRDECKDLIDFSAGFTFLVEVGQRWRPAIVSKTTGITGAAGSGDECDGSPNVAVAWAVGELDTVPPGEWVVEVTATDGSSLPRKVQIGLVVIPEVEALVP